MNDDQTDVFPRSEQQAALLRHSTSGALINESALDCENIAAEIKSVGSRLKMRIRPHARDRRDREAEVAVLLANAARRFAPAMAQRIPPPLSEAPSSCPWTLDALRQQPPA